jgi:hypothetical protein
VTHPSLWDHPGLVTLWIANIAACGFLLFRPLPVPLLLWAMVSLVRMVLQFAFTALWLIRPWHFARYQGQLLEDAFVWFCALWAAIFLFIPAREDMKRVWHLQYILFGAAILIVYTIYAGRGVAAISRMEAICWGSTLILAGIWFLIAVFGSWAGNEGAEDCLTTACGFLVIYGMDAVSGGIATWAEQTMHARMPYWLLSMGAYLLVCLWWGRKWHGQNER